MKKYTGEEFLLKIYKDLVNSELVKNSGNGGNKYEDLNAYMQRLERITKRGLEHDNLRILKQFYYEKYIIKPENVQESYFEHQEQIALERGYGHVQYIEELKKQEIEQIISEQKSSLDSWIDYFASKDTEMYPTWYKYFCFQGMVRLGYFDKKQDKYTKRTDSTTKPFIELNREAISMVYDELIKVFNKENVDDKKLEELLKNGSFSKIYAYCIKKLDSIKKSKITDEKGIWKKYLQGSNPNILFNDIHGKGTGWCTAGGLETAKMHLEDGDFYVYFTKDENGEFTCPRIAIRMEYGSIAEIRGIAENQNLESNMEKVVEKKIEEFPDKEEYKKKCKDMELLTYIYTKCKNNNNTELSIEELRFLYEIDNEIVGFGYIKDPRIEEIKNKRDIINDLNIIFKEFNKSHQTYHGSIEFFRNLTSAKGLVLPENILGNLDLEKLKDSEGIIFPKRIIGNINLRNLISTKKLVLPELVIGNLDLRSLTNAEEIIFPEEVDGDIRLGSLENAKGLKFPKKVGGYFSLGKLTSLDGLSLPEKIEGGLYLDGLTSAEGLKLPKKIEGGLYLNGLTSVEGLKLPEEINGDLCLNSITSVENLILPKRINGRLELKSLTTAKTLIMPEYIGRDLYLNGLTSANGLKLPKEIGGGISLNSLKSAEGLTLPQQIGSYIDLGGLTNAKGLKLPQKVEGTLNLDGLIDSEGLELPKIIEGDLLLTNLISGKGLVLSKRIGHTLYLKKIAGTEGLIIPEELKCSLWCSLANNDINVLKQMCKENNKTKKVKDL